MIVPSKHLPVDRSLLGVGADLLVLLDQPKTVTGLWRDLQALRGQRSRQIPFDWYVLSLTMLYSMDAVKLHRGQLVRREPQ